MGTLLTVQRQASMEQNLLCEPVIKPRVKFTVKSNGSYIRAPAVRESFLILGCGKRSTGMDRGDRLRQFSHLGKQSEISRDLEYEINKLISKSISAEEPVDASSMLKKDKPDISMLDHSFLALFGKKEYKHFA